MRRAFRAGRSILMILALYGSFAFGAEPLGVAPSAPRSAGVPPRKATWSAQVIRGSTGDRVTGLTFPESRIPVFLMPKDGKLRPVVEVRGTYARPGWKLLVQNGNNTIPLSTDAGVTIAAYLNGSLSEVFLVAKGPAGETEREKITVFAPEAREYRIGSAWGEILVSAGAAILNYFQTGFGSFSSKTGIVALKYTTPASTSRLRFSADLNLTVLTVSSAPINTGPELIEAKLDAWYLLTPPSPSHWQFWALGGGSYLTMLSNGSPFGFENLVAPEGGIRAVYSLSSDVIVIGEARYIPVGALLSLSEYGSDLGLGISKRLDNLHRIEADLGFSSYAYSPQAGIVIDNSILSFRIGYSI